MVMVITQRSEGLVGLNVSNVKETIDFSLLLKKLGRGRQKSLIQSQDFTTATHSQSVQFSSQIAQPDCWLSATCGCVYLLWTCTDWFVRAMQDREKRASVAVDGLWNMRRKRRHRDLFGIRFFVHVTGECGNGHGRCATPGSNSNPQQTYATYPDMD